MRTETVEYQDQNITLKGFLAFDGSKTEKRPAVMVIHDWSGCNDFAQNKAKDLAELGYIAFAVDLYGDGKIGKTTEEKQQLMQPLFENRAMLRQRILAGYNALKKIPQIDLTKIGAIGFCFGGMCVLDLARSGVEVRGVVSFHGFFHAPEKLPSEKIKAKILAFHGAQDPMAKMEQILEFDKEMSAQNVDWQVHIFGKSYHAFTNPAANDHDQGLVYNALDAKRAWQGMKDFFGEVLG